MLPPPGHAAAVHAPPAPTTQSPLIGARPSGELVLLEMTRSVDAGQVTELPPVTVSVGAGEVPPTVAPVTVDRSASDSMRPIRNGRNTHYRRPKLSASHSA